MYEGWIIIIYTGEIFIMLITITITLKVQLDRTQIIEKNINLIFNK